MAQICLNTSATASRSGVTFLATKRSVAKDAQTVNVLSRMNVRAMTDGQALLVT